MVLAGATLATIAGTIGVGVLGAGAAVGGTSYLSTSGKTAKSAKELAANKQGQADRDNAEMLQALADAPGNAASKARSDEIKRRRILALSGGETILTDEALRGGGQQGKKLTGQ